MTTDRRAFPAWTLPAALTLLGLVLVLIAWPRTTGEWMDTVHYVEAADGLARGGLPWIISPFYLPRFLFGESARTLTEWPLLFPGVIALFIRLGVDGVLAARLISAGCYLLLPFAFWRLARLALPAGAAACAVVLAFLANGIFHHATGGMSDTMALLLTVLGVAEVARFAASFDGEVSRRHAYLSLLFLGAAAATRYSAILVFPAVCAWLFLRAMASRKILWAVVWSAGMGLLAAFPLLFKKYGAVYSVFDRGPLSDIPTNVRLAASHVVEDIFLGGRPVPVALSAIVISAVVVAALWRAKKAGLPRSRSWIASPAALCLGVALSYIGLMIWTASHKTIDPLNTRYLMSSYPFLLIALFALLGMGRMVMGAVAICAVVGLISSRALLAREIVDDDFRPSPETIAWLKDAAAPEDVILTTDWHFARWLGRPVFQLPAWKWCGYTFQPADAGLAANAGKQVFLVVRRRDVPDATRGEKGEWGAYVRGLVLAGEAPDAIRVAELTDDIVYRFEPSVSRQKR